MAKHWIAIRAMDTVLDEIDRHNHAIAERAYQLFRTSGTGRTNPATDWTTAEHEMVWKPAVELRRRDGEYEVLAATAGVPAQDLEIQISPDDLLIKGQVHHRHTPKKGEVQFCEFDRGELFRAVHFPEKVDPDQITADYKDGLLRITAPIVERRSAGM